MKQNRMVIYSKDIQRITGKSDSYARRVIRAIRKKLHKEKHQPVSLSEFCNYMGLTQEEVAKYLDLKS